MPVLARNFAKVNDCLYRGGLPSVSDLHELKKMGLKTVVDFNVRGHPEEKLTCRKIGLRYIHKPWTAWWHHSLIWNYYGNIAEEFLIDVNDPSLHPLYIHCLHGRDRTGMLIAVYRMVCEGWTFREALKEMKRFGFQPLWHLDLVFFLFRYQHRRSKCLPPRHL